MPNRSALVSAKIHWQKSSCTTKANNLQLWEIKPCQEIQLPFLMSKRLFCAAFESIAPLLSFFSSDLYSYVYESPFVLGKSNFGWRFQLLCMGPVLYSKTVRDCCIWNIPPCLGSWELVTGFMTQVLFMADYTWAWTVAARAHAVNGAGEESLTWSLFLKKKELWEQSESEDSAEMNASNVISIIH